MLEDFFRCIQADAMPVTGYWHGNIRMSNNLSLTRNRIVKAGMFVEL